MQAVSKPQEYLTTLNNQNAKSADVIYTISGKKSMTEYCIWFRFKISLVEKVASAFITPNFKAKPKSVSDRLSDNQHS